MNEIDTINNLRNELSRQVSVIYDAKGLPNIKDIVREKIDNFTSNPEEQSFYNIAVCSGVHSEDDTGFCTGTKMLRIR